MFVSRCVSALGVRPGTRGGDALQGSWRPRCLEKHPVGKRPFAWFDEWRLPDFVVSIVQGDSAGRHPRWGELPCAFVARAAGFDEYQQIWIGPVDLKSKNRSAQLLRIRIGVFEDRRGKKSQLGGFTSTRVKQHPSCKAASQLAELPSPLGVNGSRRRAVRERLPGDPRLCRLKGSAGPG